MSASSVYPGSLDSFLTPLPNNFLNNPPHSSIEQAQNAALIALEATVGVSASTISTTIFYILVNPLSINPGHLHSSAGISGNFPSSMIVGTFPSSSITGTWPATSLNGIVSTANLPIGLGAGQILTFPASGVLPAVNGSALTNLPTTPVPWLKISTVTVSASLSDGVTTSIAEWTGLTGDTDDEYMIEFELNCASENAGDFVGLGMNGDTTANHYQWNYLRNNTGTTVACLQSTGDTQIHLIDFISSIGLIANNFGNVKIKASKTIAGTQRMAIFQVMSGAGNIANFSFGSGTWSNTSAQITQLDLYYQQNTTGSKIITGLATLYKIQR